MFIYSLFYIYEREIYVVFNNISMLCGIISNYEICTPPPLSSQICLDYFQYLSL